MATATGLICETDAELTWWRRHPLVFLVEAADDICYNIMDAEDAWCCGDLDFDTVVSLLDPLAGPRNSGQEHRSEGEYVAYLRAIGIGAAIEACVEACKDNYSAIMDGSFSTSLIEGSRLAEPFAKLKSTASRRIFTARRKTELEVSGRNILWRSLDGMLPIYEALSNADWDATRLPGYHTQLVSALELDLRGADSPYGALHNLTDYISGMTDRHAAKVARMVSGIR